MDTNPAHSLGLLMQHVCMYSTLVCTGGELMVITRGQQAPDYCESSNVGLSEHSLPVLPITFRVLY